VERYAAIASREEMEEHDFNLNIARYVDTFEAEEEVDLVAVQRDIDKIETELSLVRKEMAKALRELGL
jgi:type I restriction enzyme M protein